MSDHRASVKIEFAMHGIEDKLDMCVNYWPGTVEGVDDRVIEFFQRNYQNAMAAYHALQMEWHREAHAAENAIVDAALNKLTLEERLALFEKWKRAQ